MRDLWIGLFSGLVAAIAMSRLAPAPAQLPALRSNELPDPTRADLDLRPSMLAPTRPDPAALKLERAIGRFQFNRQPLMKVIAALADRADVNIVVHWRALEASGIGSLDPITVNLHDLPARVILRHVLTDDFDTVRLGYHITDGVVRISTMDDLARDQVTRIYDVRDLVEPAPSPDLTTQKEIAIARNENLDNLVKLIQDTLDPTSWRDSGGSTGGIRMLDGCLIITHVIEEHERLIALFAGLRSVRGLKS